MAAVDERPRQRQSAPEADASDTAAVRALCEGAMTVTEDRTVDDFAAEAGVLERVFFACFGENALRTYREAGVEVVSVDGL